MKQSALANMTFYRHHFGKSTHKHSQTKGWRLNETVFCCSSFSYSFYYNKNTKAIYRTTKGATKKPGRTELTVEGKRSKAWGIYCEIQSLCFLYSSTGDFDKFNQVEINQKRDV